MASVPQPIVHSNDLCNARFRLISQENGRKEGLSRNTLSFIIGRQGGLRTFLPK